VVSHDRVFLDAVTTRSLVLEPGTQTLRDFPGNYSFYLETLEHEREQQWQAHQDQRGEIARLSSAAARLRGQAKFRVGGKADDRDKFAKAFFANRSAGTVGRAKHLEQRLERLLTEEKIDKPRRQWQLKLDFAGDSSGPRQVLALEAVSVVFGDQPLFENVSVVLTHGQRVALVGPNGAGKTTLLRLITADLAPTSGRVQLGAGVKLGYLAQEQEILDPALNPFESIQAVAEGLSQTEIRTFLHAFLFSGDEVFIRNGDLSFGERTRLMLALLIAQGCNLLVMDEPTNHLDLPSRERFEQALSQFPGTVLAAVHDRAFIRQVATEIWELRAGELSRRTGFD
ncbi:MAG TPA: ATP-binding cassette domain-containing protein, partial [Anaerolineae bacterium]|nr:ATP-binding cassette domain-containing protein [Anaerolineae bacterium]